MSGDSYLSKCRSCLTTAFSELRGRCPKNKGRIIWYDNCLLEISPINSLGKIDYEYNFYMYNEKDVNGDTNLFNKNTRALLYRLKEKATSKENNNGKQDLPEIGGKRLGMKMLYATGEKSLRTMKLYGMVQCTKDLSIKDCIVCLNWIIAKLPTCCSNKQGGRVLSTSCNFRYELYRFVKT
ncbi:Receptor protein kinase-like protein [Arabidopsis thaliana]|uniref:Receptor protein kinase-like protein n=1 Tax=Arabidopsis thaliana TaxID=3702 RepID=A0A1I9LLK8_ARATH|nr:Receptor protein kinase-like protein [Arabidopsis thaliana]ANM63466.1 Receptor protein kinase-like protein [Arabidopsis thaliana]|eukprot:NP_001325552.1 Receptor protein kinase-like protein [Arabidopsis thaliana]